MEITQCEDVFSFLSQPPPLPQNHTLTPDVFYYNIPECVIGDWDEIGRGFHAQIEPLPPPPQLLLDYKIENGAMIGESFAVEEKNKGIRRCREDEENSSASSKKFTRKLISQYFYMPLAQTARELNVGVSFLKERCRELGIPRWPYRKLKSLQTLINNVQEFGKEEGEGKLKESLEILEHEKKLMEETPDMKLEDKTKRARQAFYKSSCKKRKQMAFVELSSRTAASAMADVSLGEFDEEDEALRNFFYDCISFGFDF